MGRVIGRSFTWIAVFIVGAAVVFTAIQLIGQKIPTQSATNARSMVDVEITEPKQGAIVRSASVVVNGNASRNATVDVNGIPVQLDRGHFRLEVDLKYGTNTIAAVASVTGLDPATASVDVVRNRE